MSEQRYFDLHFSGGGRALRGVTGAFLPRAPARDVPVARTPPRLEWSCRGRVLVEITTVPELAPAAGRFVDEGFLDLAGADWERVPAGPVYLRVTGRASGDVLVSTAFRKDEPLSPGPGGGRA